MRSVWFSNKQEKKLDSNRSIFMSNKCFSFPRLSGNRVWNFWQSGTGFWRPSIIQKKKSKHCKESNSSLTQSLPIFIQMIFKARNLRLKSIRPYILPIFASNSLKLSFKLFFLTDFSNYCEGRLTFLQLRISRNLNSNFWNLGSRSWIFGNHLATFWHSSEHATFKHLTSTIGTEGI